MKHYAYYNMSRRTQLTTKYLFQVLAQLSENFIFIYLGLSLFTDNELVLKPLFITVTVIGICAARWCAVFPLSRLINMFIRYRAKKRGKEVADELPYSYQAMLFWAGLRGAVGVALAAGLTGSNSAALRATVLVVVVLTVIIFGGTTARMLEILGIRTGVVEELDSDDEFDIEAVTGGGSYVKRGGTAFGHNPRRSGTSAVSLDAMNGRINGGGNERSHYASGNSSPANHARRPSSLNRKTSNASQRRMEASEQGLLGRSGTGLSESDDLEDSDSDLPPLAIRRDGGKTPTERVAEEYPTSGHRDEEGRPITAGAAISQLINGTAEDHAAWFRQLDEGFIKPHLLLDPPGKPPGKGGSGSS